MASVIRLVNWWVAFDYNLNFIYLVIMYMFSFSLMMSRHVNRWYMIIIFLWYYPNYSHKIKDIYRPVLRMGLLNFFEKYPHELCQYIIVSLHECVGKCIWTNTLNFSPHLQHIRIASVENKGNCCQGYEICRCCEENGWWRNEDWENWAISASIPYWRLKLKQIQSQDKVWTNKQTTLICRVFLFFIFWIKR